MKAAESKEGGGNMEIDQADFHITAAPEGVLISV